MIRAVYDCNVMVSGIGWNGSARQCLKLVAARSVFLFVTNEILAEYESIVPDTLKEEMPDMDPAPKLNWIRAKSRLVEPSPLGKRRSRDSKDDIYLAGALAASAQYIVSYDADLLVLEKPFGIEIIRPAEFIRRLGQKSMLE
ncbi:MAG TPA: putative toxin-antitoxin system toxin component, PIN family [Verrucomicrobiae bacterium]|jgi:putative PIN family toxin of toxin-antitoxin system